MDGVGVPSTSKGRQDGQEVPQKGLASRLDSGLEVAITLGDRQKHPYLSSHFLAPRVQQGVPTGAIRAPTLQAGRVGQGQQAWPLLSGGRNCLEDNESQTPTGN